MRNVKIRRAHLDDILRLKEIEDLVFKRQGINERRGTIKNRVIAFPRGCFVAEENGVVVGYTLAELRKRITHFALNDDARRLHSSNGPYFYVAGLAVHPQFQRKGIGRALLQKQIVLAKSLHMKAVVLTTWYARAYYPQFGFNINKTVYHKDGRVNYYVFAMPVA